MQKNTQFVKDNLQMIIYPLERCVLYNQNSDKNIIIFKNRLNNF